MRNVWIILRVVALLLVSMNISWAAITDLSSFEKALIGKKNAQKQQAIAWLVNNQQAEIAQTVLNAWLAGNLYYLNPSLSSNQQSLYITTNVKTATEATSAWSEQIVAIENSRQLKKVRVNNRLRKEIRLQLAVLGINSSDSHIRYNAIMELLGTDDKELLSTISERLSIEEDKRVIEMIKLSMAIHLSQDITGSKDERILAIETVAQYKLPIVAETLNHVLSETEDPAILKAANLSLTQYQQSQSLYSGLETAFFGLSMGSVLVLAGIGLAITFGVMGVINMAHGELIMIGAYTAYVIQQLMPNHIGVALLVSIPAAFIVAGLVGIVIERSVIRHLYGRPLETLLATFGISLILQQAVRSIFSPLNRSVSTPEWMSGALEINPMLSLTYNRLYIVLFCGLVFWGLLMVLKKTPLGLQVRAVSQNRGMARAMGIRSERVDALTFGLGSGVAGIAGVALSQLTNVGPNMGQAYIIDSFMVVVFGGVGNLWGTLVAGLSLGLFNKVLEPWAGAVLAKILVLVFIILFIQKRPRGLFPQRGRAAES
ncbi:urea ABC transporter permease subunit UrtB [Vibrio sp. UCD-FRSSP16_10]|uniref:urea ABC transporter permease subunit UrtB n=1 Tax=unclassified Vibrio TaxID=2614977 RepID=UPI0007FCBBEF|nr:MULTISPECIES: urea ABC transporter permease subunit UrtB [unclassified Vibrio]OBT10133.1 urea ABC transporter permease subunit UrtB [Vibrio sp. UCD-FRSSP16_30]OBT18923.1 urea ABC transporter permease subunit UrtB [Vibrio sp. UCD-FRSSP16_10]